jgi:hypothetical protein
MNAPRRVRAKRLNRSTVMHYTDTRLMVNAGMTMPACFSGAELLDMDKSRLPSTRNLALVDCKRCLNIVEASR